MFYRTGISGGVWAIVGQYFIYSTRRTIIGVENIVLSVLSYYSRTIKSPLLIGIDKFNFVTFYITVISITQIRLNETRKDTR